MGRVTFEGEAPYVLPALQSAEVYGRQSVVVAYLYVAVNGRPQSLEIQMQPAQATELAIRLNNAVRQS